MPASLLISVGLVIEQKIEEATTYILGVDFMKLMSWFQAAIFLCFIFFLASCTSNEVKIGVIIPERGSLAGYGYQIRSGIQMAFEETKLRTDLKKSYELIYENEDETDIEGIRGSFMRLKEQKVTAIIGCASSAGTLALAELANANNIVLLSPSSSSPEINTGNSDFVYRNYPSDTLEAQSLSNSIFQKIRLQKIVMARARNTFSEGVTFEMLKFGRQNSRHIPNRVIKFNPDPSQVDWKLVVDEITTEKPHGLFMAAYTDELIPLIREIRSRKDLDHVFLFTCSAFVLEDAIQELGKDLIEGLMFTNYTWEPNDPSNTNVQQFTKKFEAIYLTHPGIFSATGYDALNILVESIDEVNHGLSDELTDHLNKNAFLGILGETDFNKSGNITRIPHLYRVTNGVKEEVTNEMYREMKEDVLTKLEYDISSED